MISIRQMLDPLYKHTQTRAALRVLVPTRFRPRLQKWLRPRGEVHWCRVVMNREIERFIRSLDCASLDVLEVSGTGSQGRYNFRTYKTTDFPDYNICTGPMATEKFDLVIAEQVFEHVMRPDLAATHVYQMLRPGGRFVISTPFLLKVHGSPCDFYRWTEQGMRQLLECAGFVVISTGSWGNRECLIADMTAGLGWTTYDPELHNLHNEPQFAIVVWAFAAKPRSD